MENCKLRDTDNPDLWALCSTVECTLYGCTSCAYKLLISAPKILDEVRLVPRCRPNERPESCVRLSKHYGNGYDESSGLYETSQNILVVGDGDFSFSKSLALCWQNSKRNDKSFLICTSYQAISHLKKIYPGMEKNIKDLTSSRVKVIHEIDATKLETYENIKLHQPYDRIIWNFPCVDVPDGRDGQNDELEANKRLIRDFISQASKIISHDKEKPGQIHIVHKTKEPFSWWDIPGLAEDLSLIRYDRSVVFDRSVFPEYRPRKVNDKKSFPTGDAVTHVFISSSAPEVAVDSPNVDMPFSLEILKKHRTIIKVTQPRLRQIVCLLQLPKVLQKKEHKRDFADGPRTKANKRDKRKKKR